ncbi:MAG: MFS transporter [Hamadaea sp.]|uniref:MFS transporter n=1 Tax=Hamadaea sp. TaxID=2024425 RepID=UPI0017BA74D2|nr:MFS transporter [Hamadaea sp.]NUR69630.1 MFS transporter [Hamadaea sp.]NUT23336.1 MFS transporter [Hamadaea sp.]
MSQQTLPTRALPRTGTPTRELRPHRPGLALAIVLSCQLMLILDATVMNVALPRIQSDLGFSAAGLSWVMTAYSLTFGGLLLLGGRIGDIFGRRRAFVAGVALFTVASLLGGFAPSAGWLIAARLAQGVGAALAGPSTVALVTTTFTETRARIRALSLLSGIASAGFAIGLILGGILTQAASWRWVLFVNVPFGIAAVLLAPRYVREPERHPARLDIPGALTATGGVAALVAGFTRAAERGWSDPWTAILLGSGVLLVAGFLAIEVRTRQPMLPLRLFADRNRASAYAVFLIGPAAMMSMFFFLTQFLQDVRGFDALRTGLAFLPMAGAMFVFTRALPRLLPKFGMRRMAFTGIPLMILGLLWLTRLTPDTAYFPGVFGPMLLMGLGIGIGFVPLTPTIMATVPPQDAGAAGGAMQTMQQTGASLGIAVLVTVFGTAARQAASGGSSAIDATIHGMTTAFGVSTGFAVIALLVATTFQKR